MPEGDVGRRTSWRAWLGPVAVLALVATCGTGMAAADAAPVDHVEVLAGEAGVAMGGPWTWLEEDAQARDLDRVASLGVGWIRVSFPWSAIENRPGRLEWDTHDTIVRLAHERGLRVLANVAYTPRWARSPACSSIKCAPLLSDRFASFVGQVVDRYAGRGLAAIEIWNEPNLWEHWRPRPDPKAYTALLVRSHAASKRADDRITVVTGGLAPSRADGRSDIGPLAFLRGVYTAGGAGAFDAVGAHPYSATRAPLDPHPSNPFAHLHLGHELMAEWGDADKDIWITEYGYATSDAALLRPAWSVTPEQQAQYLREAYTATAARAWTGPTIWYALRDESTYALEREDSFGLFRRDGSPKPAAAVLRSMVAG